MLQNGDGNYGIFVYAVNITAKYTILILRLVTKKLGSNGGEFILPNLYVNLFRAGKFRVEYLCPITQSCFWNKYRKRKFKIRWNALFLLYRTLASQIITRNIHFSKLTTKQRFVFRREMKRIPPKIKVFKYYISLDTEILYVRRTVYITSTHSAVSLMHLF